jgi:ABC-2 type transport system permease protein
MNFSHLLAMTWARTLEFLRDRSALSWNLLVPVIMVAGIGWVFSGPGRPLFKVAVVADSPLSATLHPFLATEHIHFYRETDLQATIRKVQRHRVDMLLDLRQAPGKYWVNEESPKGDVLDKMVLVTAGPKLERQTATGADIRYVDWLVPGVLGMNMMFSCLFGIGYVIVRYRKSGYLKRLNATPLTALEFILAQLLSRLVLILAITVAVFAGTNTFLHFRMEGSYLDLFVVTLVGCVSMIAMGLVISARVTSEELAGGLLNVLSWPMMVLSGVFFSVDGAPAILQSAAAFFPLTHLLNAARAIMLDGARLPELIYPLSVLSGMAVVFLALGASVFRWRQS